MRRMSAYLDWNPPKGKGGKCHHQQRHNSRQSLSLCLCVCVCHRLCGGALRRVGALTNPLSVSLSLSLTHSLSLSLSLSLSAGAGTQPFSNCLLVRTELAKVRQTTYDLPVCDLPASLSLSLALPLSVSRALSQGMLWLLHRALDTPSASR